MFKTSLKNNLFISKITVYVLANTFSPVQYKCDYKSLITVKTGFE